MRSDAASEIAAATAGRKTSRTTTWRNGRRRSSHGPWLSELLRSVMITHIQAGANEAILLGTPAYRRVPVRKGLPNLEIGTSPEVGPLIRLPAQPPGRKRPIGRVAGVQMRQHAPDGEVRALDQISEADLQRTDPGRAEVIAPPFAMIHEDVLEPADLLQIRALILGLPVHPRQMEPCVCSDRAVPGQGLKRRVF